MIAFASPLCWRLTELPFLFLHRPRRACYATSASMIETVLGQTRTSSLGAAVRFRRVADIGPGGQSVGLKLRNFTWSACSRSGFSVRVVSAPILTRSDARLSLLLTPRLPKTDKAAFRRPVRSNSITKSFWSRRRGSNPRSRPWPGSATPQATWRRSRSS